MAQENCLPADGSRQHATGDSVRIPGRHTWRPGRRRSRSRHRSHLLGYGRASRSHGQRGPVATFAFRMVPGHHLLFSGDVFLLQDADVKKGAARRAAIVRMSAPPTASSITLDLRRSRFSATFSYFSLLPLLQPLLELRLSEQPGPETASNSHRSTRLDGRTSRYPD